MGINSILNIASSGIRMAQVAIEVTSENIANVNTSGYSRQRVILETSPVTSSNGFPLGTGVQLSAVQRNHDELLQLQIAKGNSSYGESLAKQTALDQIEPTFNELTSDGLGQAMEDFFNSWQDLSANPQGSAERQTVLARAQILVDNFHQMNTSLQDAVANADNSLVGITADIAEKAKNIASLNNQILQTERLGGNANELRDRRDYLVQELSKQAGVNYSEQSDGTLTVSLQGGDILVQGNQYATVYTNSNGTDNDIMMTGLGNPPPATDPTGDKDITSTIGGTDNSLGAVGGTLQVRDEMLPGYLARLDEMANQLVSAVNTQHYAGYAPDGNKYNFFDPANTTSGTISLDSSLTAATIAAAGQDPTTVSGQGDNTNALALAKLKTTSLTFTAGGNTTSATVASFYNSLVTSVGIDTQNAKNANEQDDSFLKQLNSIRESNSGVSLDEELTNLIKYQRAFEASAKMINAASDMMDTVLNLVR